jgi:hypothetical protein
MSANATTVSDGIRVLPLEFKQNFTFVKNGSALQSSTKDFPRAIMFGDTAHLIASFNGQSFEMGYDSIETAEFDESKKEILYRSILFKNEPLGKELSGSLDIFGKEEIAYQDQNIIVSKPNPRICVGCHVNSPLDMETSKSDRSRLLFRYIWSRPHEWSTSYGAKDNLEGQDFLQMKAKWIQHPRYGQLFEPGTQASGVYPYHSSNIDRVYTLMPNARLADLMAHHYSMQMANVLKAKSDFKNLLHAELKRRCGGLNGHELLTEGMRQFGFQFDYPALELDLSNFDKTNYQYEPDTTSLGNDIAISTVIMSSNEQRRYARKLVESMGLKSRGQMLKQTLSVGFENSILRRFCEN